MLLAMTLFEQSLFWLIVVSACLIHFGKKAAASKGPVASAAKEIAAHKAAGFLRGLFK
jgi:hypothetical protein